MISRAEGRLHIFAAREAMAPGDLFQERGHHKEEQK